MAGSTLTATAGTWTGTLPMTLSNAWRRCDAAGATCQTIIGQVGLTYDLTAADAGHTLRFAVGAVNVAGSALATSAQTAVVTAAPSTTFAPPAAKQQCMRGGWRTFTSPKFRNQGQCIKAIVSKAAAHGHHDTGDGVDRHSGGVGPTVGSAPGHGNGKGHDSR